jgi:hypothetical protein
MIPPESTPMGRHRPGPGRPHSRAAAGCRVALCVAVALVGCRRAPTTVTNYVRPEKQGEAWIIATPNPVPIGPVRAKTYVNWYTGDGGPPPQVYVSINGGPEKFFSNSGSGQEATLITKGVYEFRLYPGTDRKAPLATVKVTRSAP